MVKKNEFITFVVDEYPDFYLITFDIGEYVLHPEDLRRIKPPKLPGNKGIILSGRGTVWLYSFLVHYYHYTRWVATFSPRDLAGIVVESHDPAVQVGDLIPVPL